MALLLKGEIYTICVMLHPMQAISNYQSQANIPEQMGWKVLEMKTKASQGSWWSLLDLPGSMVPPRTHSPLQASLLPSPSVGMRISQSFCHRNHLLQAVLSGFLWLLWSHLGSGIFVLGCLSSKCVFLSRLPCNPHSQFSPCFPWCLVFMALTWTMQKNNRKPCSFL